MKLRTSALASSVTRGSNRPGSLGKASRALLRGALLLALVALVVTSMPAGADHSWGSYHWARVANPFTLGLGDNVSTTWDSYLAKASGADTNNWADWSDSSVLDTEIVPGLTNPNRCGATSGRVEVCSAKYGRNGWLGIATIWVSGGHIVQGTAKLNDTYFNMPSYNTPAWRQSVMCQEIGHTFGLDHQDENFNNANLGSCMDYTSDPDGDLSASPPSPSNEYPNAHDYEQLDGSDDVVGIYSHLDATSTVGSTTSGDSAAPGHRPEDWGRVVKRYADGKPAVYEKDLGAGRKMFTFVIWAREGGPPA